MRFVWIALLLGACSGEMSDSQRMAAVQGMTAVSQGYFAMAAAQTPRTINCLGCY